MANDERFEFLRQSIESHDRQIGELTEGLASLKETVAAQTANIDKLVRVTNEDAIAIRTLARIADAHEQRIVGLEGDGKDQ
jgi:hypothetical protein